MKQLNSLSNSGIMTAEEVALFFGMSVSWVYKNQRKLGGVKLRGSLFFPRKEELYEHIFHQGKGVEVRLHPDVLQLSKSSK